MEFSLPAIPPLVDVGPMDVSDARKLRALEEENSKLKRLLADAMLDVSALKELMAKKW
jgi:putative transposase